MTDILHKLKITGEVEDCQDWVDRHCGGARTFCLGPGYVTWVFARETDAVSFGARFEDRLYQEKTYVVSPYQPKQYEAQALMGWQQSVWQCKI